MFGFWAGRECEVEGKVGSGIGVAKVESRKVRLSRVYWYESCKQGSAEMVDVSSIGYLFFVFCLILLADSRIWALHLGQLQVDVVQWDKANQGTGC